MRHLPLAALTMLLVTGVADAQTGSQVFSLVTADTAILLQWTEAGGQLKGSAQVVKVSVASADIHLVVTNSGLSGTRSGDDYSLVFDKSILGQGVSSASARITKEGLHLNIPSDKGGLNDLNLQRDTLEGFNATIEKFKTDAAIRSKNLSNGIILNKAIKQVEDDISAIRSNLLRLELIPIVSKKLEAAKHFMQKAA